MSGLDPIKLTQIIGAISSRNGKLRESSTSEPKNTKERSNNIHLEKTRQISILEKKLKSEIKRISPDNKDFNAVASSVVINEVVLWEFGEDFINHPEFRHITDFVFSTIRTNEALNKSIQNLIENLSSS